MIVLKQLESVADIHLLESMADLETYSSALSLALCPKTAGISG